MDKSKKIKLYYSIPEQYPPFRVDISELFSKSLVDKGLNITWYMSASDENHQLHQVRYYGQRCFLPPRYQSSGAGIKVINKILYWLYDIYLLGMNSAKEYDFIQVRDKYIASAFGLIFSRITGKKFIYWCSYPYPEHTLEMAESSRGIKRLLLKLQGQAAKFILYRIIIKFSDYTFVQSDQMLSEIKKLGIQEKKMTPVPMGVPERLLDWVNTKSIPVNPKTVVYLGTLAAVRRLHTIIEAFLKVVDRHPDAKLIMVGEGTTPLERLELEQYAIEFGIEKNVIFTGFVPIDKAWEIAASGAVCLSPIYPTKTLNVGSPTKLIEYLALGRPVVCNNHPEQSMIIQESGAGLCVDWSVQAFAEAITFMLDNMPQAESMASKGPAWVQKNRTYTNIANQVWEKYQALLES